MRRQEVPGISPMSVNEALTIIKNHGEQSSIALRLGIDATKADMPASALLYGQMDRMVGTAINIIREPLQHLGLLSTVEVELSLIGTNGMSIKERVFLPVSPDKYNGKNDLFATLAAACGINEKARAILVDSLSNWIREKHLGYNSTVPALKPKIKAP